MKTIFITIALYCVTCAAHATSQVPEVLVFEGTTNDMYSTPLESLFTVDNPKPKLFYEQPSSTACSRCYVGTWKIEGGELHLVVLRQGHPGTDLIPLDNVDPKWVSPVQAKWFTGTLRIGKGKVLMKGMGFSEKREMDIFMEIKDGKVVSTRQIDNTKEKDVAEPAPPAGRGEAPRP